MATTAERRLFVDNILEPIGRAAQSGQRIVDGKLTGFLAMKGPLYKPGGLMVVGRAVNGWCDGVLPTCLADSAFRTAFSRRVEQSVNDHPMEWVRDHWGGEYRYNARRSAFWRVIRGVTVGLSIAREDDREWPLHLVWSNLYKLSPEKGGNPRGALVDAQLPGCKELLELELKNYRPGRLLFLTGKDWADPFVDTRGEKLGVIGWGHRAYVQRNAKLRAGGIETHLVVAVHPQGKSEQPWVADVIQHFET